jgi:hypothetical protein
MVSAISILQLFDPEFVVSFEVFVVGKCYILPTVIYVHYNSKHYISIFTKRCETLT